MAGPEPRYVIRLTEEQHGKLKKLSRSHSEPWIEVQRARILVSAHEHPDWSNHKIAGQVGCRVDMVKKCRRHWQRNPSVKSLPRPGSPRKFTALQRSQIVALACSNPGEHGKPWKRWSNEKLSRTAVEKKITDSISAATIGRWLREDQIKPWRYHSWQKSMDPRFVEKAGPILDLYEKAEKLAQKKEAVICVDEKTSVQARRPLDETLPAVPGQPVRVCDRYERKGFLQLFCALTVATGVTFARCFDRKCFSDFKTFLVSLFDSAVCKGLKTLDLILDNGPTHAPKQLGTWIASLELSFKVKIFWLPTHASWLDQVEIVFSKVQRDLLTPCDFQDKDALETELMNYFDHLNYNPKPINWSYTKEKMIAKFSLPN